MLRRSPLRCDEYAPTDPSSQDIASWNKREDVLALRRSGDYYKNTKIRSIFHTLGRLQTKEARQQFFEEANRRRALGQPIDDVILLNGRSGITRTRSSYSISVTGKISSLFKGDKDGPPGPG